MRQFQILSLGLLFFLAGSARGQSGPNWLSLEEGQTLASEENKILFVFVEAEWCAICKQMKKEVFPNTAILELLEGRFASTRIDLDSKHPVLFNGTTLTERSFAESMEVVATPTLIFADSDGKILGDANGFYDQERLLVLLKYLDSDQFQEVTFLEFEEARKNLN